MRFPNRSQRSRTSIRLALALWAAAAWVPQADAAPRSVADLTATGVQVYRCQAGGDAAAHAQWTLVAPDAKLLDESGRPVGRHYAGPTWELDDGSKLVGEVVQRTDAPDPTAIPWLVLRVKASSGAGRLAAVQSIRREDTRGGKAPPGDCDPARQKDDLRVPYSATYRFFPG